MLEMFPNVGGVEKSFGRNAANQQTAPTKPRLPFDERSFQSILAGAHCRRISAGTAANYSDIVSHFRLKCSIQALFFRGFKP
jgi:hypothetical protein